MFGALISAANEEWKRVYSKVTYMAYVCLGMGG